MEYAAGIRGRERQIIDLFIAAFTDRESALNLAATRLRCHAGTEWSTNRYLSMALLKDHQASNVTA